MSKWMRFKRWIMTRYYWWIAPYDTWNENNTGFTWANSTEAAFNLVAPKNPLNNPPKDLSHDEKYADGIVMKGEFVQTGMFDNPAYLNIERLQYVVLKKKDV